MAVRQLVMFLCCFLSVGSAMLLETDEGVERRLLGNSSSNHTSFLHLTFINPFSNYHYLMHLFSRGNIAAPAFLLLFWAVVPFLMTLLAFLDGRPVVVMQSVAIWRLHLLSYGLVTYSSARDAPRAAVLGNDSVSQSVFSRRKPLLKLVKFLVFKLWDRIRSCHTWISVLSPPLEHRLTISRCQRAALLGVEMMANAVFVCITLGSIQNTLLQITIISGLTVVLVKGCLMPLEPLFEWCNTFHSHTEGKHANANHFWSRVREPLPRDTPWAYWASTLAVLRFHFVCCRRHRRPGPFFWKQLGKNARTSRSVRAPASSVRNPLTALEMTVVRDRNTVLSWGPGLPRVSVARLAAPSFTAEIGVQGQPHGTVEELGDIEVKQAVLSVFATLQSLVGLFALALGIYSLTSTNIGLPSVIILLSSGTALTAFGVAAFVLVRKGHNRVAVLAVILSVVFEATTGVVMPYAHVSSWRILLIVMGCAHGALLTVALLVVSKVLHSYLASQVKRREEAAALSRLKDSITDWRADPVCLLEAEHAARIVVKAIRDAYLRRTVRRRLEIVYFERMSCHRQRFLHLVYALVFFVFLVLTYVNCVYLGMYTPAQSVNMLYSFVGVIVYDFFLFDPLFVAIEVGVRFVYQISHKDIEFVVRDGRRPSGAVCAVPQHIRAMFTRRPEPEQLNNQRYLYPY